MDDYLQASRFEEHCEDFVKIKGSQLHRLINGTGASRLSDLSVDRVSTYLQSLRKKELSSRTINQFRSSVVAWLNWCVKNGRLDHHTLDRIPRLNEDLDRRRHRRAATPEEVERFLAAVPPRRKFIYQVAMYTGLRRGEMNQIEWRDIDLKAATLTVRAEVGKTRKPVILPLHADVVELLRDRVADMKPNELVFKPVPHIETFKDDLAAAGIPFKDDNDRQLDFHSLRSTFATLLLRNGVQPAVARRLTRHSSVKTLEKHYDKLGLADAADAIKQLPSFNLDSTARL